MFFSVKDTADNRCLLLRLALRMVHEASAFPLVDRALPRRYIEESLVRRAQPRCRLGVHGQSGVYGAMNLMYFKRYRMEIDLAGRNLAVEPWPEAYRLLPWDESLLDEFAQAKYKSFRNEIDANVFPCLGDWAGCRRLMVEISRKPGFLPGATWLLSFAPPEQRRAEYCGTVQGVRDREGWGAIQNLGVTSDHRGHGLGARLMYMALRGFCEAGITRAHLEVTAHNEGAIRLYRRMGFVIVKTLFKVSEVTCSS